MSLKKSLTAFVYLMLLALFFVLMMASSKKVSVTTFCTASKRTPRVIIDAGHGGEDGGAVSADGVLEKELNLKMSLNTADLIRLMGFEVELTRQDDGSLSDEGDTVKKRKFNDMKKRLDIYNSSEDNVIISIHQNKFSDTSSKGTQVFYSPNNESSAVLANCIQRSVRELLQPDNTRECKDTVSGIYLLKNTTRPAVLVECGFLSNIDECSLLVTEEYQRQMSFAVTTGFLDYFAVCR